MKLSKLIRELSVARDKIKDDPEIIIRKLPIDTDFSGSIVDILVDDKQVKIIVLF